MSSSISFDGGYGNVGSIAVEKPCETQTCAGCGANHVPLLVSDSSQNEYNPGCICLECLLARFIDFIRENDGAYCDYIEGVLTKHAP
jgi:hypothetical protein